MIARVLLFLLYFGWPQLTRILFFCEGFYIVLLALTPVTGIESGLLRHFVLFSIIILWILLYYSDFYVSLFLLNLVVLLIFFAIYPFTYGQAEL